MGLADLAVLGIAEVASMALLEQMVTNGGTVAGIRSEVETSAYWTEFCELAAAGAVPADFIRPESLATSVLAWAAAAQAVR